MSLTRRRSAGCASAMALLRQGYGGQGTTGAPVKFTEDTKIGLTEDGAKLVLPIPVSAQHGFMILQSGDAKVGADKAD